MTHPALTKLKSAVLDPAPKIRDIVADAPRLAHTVEGLESDRRDLLAAFDILSSRHVDQAAEEDLVERLIEYRQRASDLLYQAYGVDLGGET
jgi:hypothetical protein